MKTFNCLTCGETGIWRHQTVNKYCSLTCQQRYQYLQYIKEWKEGNVDGRKGKLQTSNHIKRYVLEKYNHKCAECNINNWNGKSIVLELDHVNGQSTDNREENLRVLCPNCHSQTHTYKAKNKGNGRKER